MTGKIAPDKQKQFVQDEFDSAAMPPVQHAGEFELPPFDDAKYRKEIEDFDLTEEQAIEFLRNLNSILVAFVNLGFGVDAVQLAIPGLAEFSSQAESGALQINDPIGTFNGAATESLQKG